MLGMLETLERIERKVDYRSSEKKYRATASQPKTDDSQPKTDEEIATEKAAEREDKLQRQVIFTDEQHSAAEVNDGLLLSKVQEILGENDFSLCNSLLSIKSVQRVDAHFDLNRILHITLWQKNMQTLRRKEWICF